MQKESLKNCKYLAVSRNKKKIKQKRKQKNKK